MEKYKFMTIASVLGICLFILFLVLIVPRIPKESMCYAKEEALRLSIEGAVLIKKFRDAPNHNYKTIRFRMNGEDIESHIFVLEESGCYDYLLEGDTIFKAENTVSFRVTRHGKDTLFNLNYGCN